MVEEAASVLAVQALDVVERGHQPLDFAHAVAYGDVGQHIAYVSEFELNVVLVAQQVIDLNARKSEVEGEDGELGLVEVIDRIAVDQLLPVGIVASDLVDFAPRVLGYAYYLPEGFLAAQGQVPSGYVEAGEKQI